MNHLSPVDSAEQEFRDILEKFFIDKFDESSPSSHNIEHHRRVWKYAKELLPHYRKINPRTGCDLPQKLIIACFLHDIGMSVDPGVKHGHHSRNLCKQFLKENHLKETDFIDVLSAIEYHDEKEYNYSHGENNILKILSIADDLDAFGFTGIFRYTEIYLMRKASIFQIGRMIRDNARGRFENFRNNFGNSVELVHKHEERYRILDDFFTEYNLNAPHYEFGKIEPEGLCGIIDIINNIIHKRSNYPDLTSVSMINHKDPFIKWFFNGFNEEIS
ncbi:MAG: HD domain-containing protein [Bacteroidales bacterium]|nr:HD domain-containing protein [Bacteroidales bacterium]